MKSLIRRMLIGSVVVVLGFSVVLAIEIVLAFRREYLPTDSPLELDRTFGSGTGPALRFVVLGDSTAAGLGVTDPDEAYASVLATRLADETGRKVRLTVFGVSGARVRDVLTEQVPAAVELDPDVIFVGIGANDVTHVTGLDDVKGDMALALSTLKETGATIVVAGAPDMRVFAWHEPLRTVSYLRGKQVTGAIEDVARSEGIPVVELAKETGPLFAEDPVPHFSSDEFHPSGLGYSRWADAIFPVLLEAVQSD